MQSLALIVHVALSIGVIVMVLLQHGKGADAGAAFGSGASSTVFGARGSASFLTRMTTLLASLFFVTSLVLFYFAAHRDRELGSVTDDLPVIEQPADAPAAPVDGSGGGDGDADGAVVEGAQELDAETLPNTEVIDSITQPAEGEAPAADDLVDDLPAPAE